MSKEMRVSIFGGLTMIRKSEVVEDLLPYKPPVFVYDDIDYLLIDTFDTNTENEALNIQRKKFVQCCTCKNEMYALKHGVIMLATFQNTSISGSIVRLIFPIDYAFLTSELRH